MHSASPSLAATFTTMLASTKANPWYIWSILSCVATFGVATERTAIGSMLSSPLVTMMTSMILCNIGLLPSDSLVYSAVLKWLVPLSIPLLLLDADLRRCVKATGGLLKAFLVGSVGTVIGTIVAYALVPLNNMVGGEKIAAALCARHIGGAVNFVAVSDILRVPPEMIAAAMAADNVVVALYFAYLFLISVPERGGDDSSVGPSSMQPPIAEPQRAAMLKDECPIPFFRTNNTPVNGQDTQGTTPSALPQEETIVISSNAAASTSAGAPMRRGDGLGLLRLSTALSVGLVLCALSQGIGAVVGVSPMLLVSLLAVAAATLFPVPMGKVAKAGGVLGVILMQFFFAVTGGMGHIPTVLSYGPALFMHTTIQIVVHFAFIVAVGKVLKLPFREVILASNANVGGPTTAAAMATSKRWKLLVLPALLTGIFGYAIATGVGVGVARVLSAMKR